MTDHKTGTADLNAVYVRMSQVQLDPGEHAGYTIAHLLAAVQAVAPAAWAAAVAAWAPPGSAEARLAAVEQRALWWAALCGETERGKGVGYAAREILDILHGKPAAEPGEDESAEVA